MSFQWDKQPYRWLGNLADKYTAVLMTATKYKVEERAKEATTWMRENAPWEDRTAKERIRQDGRNHQSARKGLHAKVYFTSDEMDVYDFGLNEARKADVKLLAKTNRERASEFATGEKERLANYEKKAFELHANRGVESAPFKSKSYIPIKRLGNTMSNVVAYNKKYEKDLPILMTLQMRYNPYRDYAIWLELANNGRYAILARAVEHFGRILHNDIQQIANLKQFSHISFSEDVVSQAEQFESFVDKNPGYKPFTEEVRKNREQGRIYRKYGPSKRGGRYKKRQ